MLPLSSSLRYYFILCLCYEIELIFVIMIWSCFVCHKLKSNKELYIFFELKQKIRKIYVVMLSVAWLGFYPSWYLSGTKHEIIGLGGELILRRPHAALLRPPMEIKRLFFHFKTSYNKTDASVFNLTDI